MMAQVSIPLPGRSYDVVIGNALDFTAILKPLKLGNDWLVIYDTVFDTLAEGEVLRGFADTLGACARVRLFAVPSGEASKSLAYYGQLAEKILADRITRDTVVIAFGGGVIGDLAGFLAASLLRGLRFVQIPTTLLAQVDSSVGGKVGINAHAGKNLIGAFHQPSVVLADLAMLAYLPRREFSAGIAEVLKAALLADHDFWLWLEDHAEAIRAREPSRLEALIVRAVRIKADVVLADETERTGRRALLNLGHTFAHALEAAAGYDGVRLIHGEAVAIGMTMAARLSAELGMIPSSDVVRIETLLHAFALPTTVQDVGFAAMAEDLYRLMQYDKKTDQQGLKLVLLARLGQAVVRSALSQGQIMAAIQPSLEV